MDGLTQAIMDGLTQRGRNTLKLLVGEISGQPHIDLDRTPLATLVEVCMGEQGIALPVAHHQMALLAPA